MTALGRANLLHIWAFIRLGRPQFLLGGLTPFVLGTVVAGAEGFSLDWVRFCLGQVVVSSLQLMTHYANDYFDFDADLANQTSTRWSGGSRILPKHILPPSAAICGAIFWLAVASLGFIGLHRHGSPAMALWIALIIAVVAWSYSAPPMRLHSRGVGELAATAIVAVLVPCFAHSVQSGTLSRLSILATMPLALLQFAMLVAVSVPDAEADRLVGKKTLAARCGLRRTARVMSAALLVSYLGLPLLLRMGLPRYVVVAVAATAPLAVIQLLNIRGERLEEPHRWERLTLVAVALVFACGLAEAIGFYLWGIHRGTGADVS